MSILTRILTFMGVLAMSNPSEATASEAKHIDHTMKIAEYVTKNVGSVHSTVSFNMPTTGDHLTIIIVAPSKSRDHYLLITSGLSEKAMYEKGDKNGSPNYAELVMGMPKTWRAPMGEDDLKNLTEEDLIPLVMLLRLAELPRVHNLSLDFGHTLPAANIASGFTFPRVMFHFTLMDELVFIDLPSQTKGRASHIKCLGVYPITEAEFNYKKEHDSDELLDMLVERGNGIVFDVRRKSIF
jgi:hypothetical protein